jgi:hypothetical protein
MDHCEVLLIGGRAGVGRTSVGLHGAGAPCARAAEFRFRLGAQLPRRQALFGRLIGHGEQDPDDPDGVPHRPAEHRRRLVQHAHRVHVHEAPVSARKARMPDARAPVDTLRVVTDGRTVIDIAADVAAATGWAPARIS